METNQIHSFKTNVGESKGWEVVMEDPSPDMAVVKTEVFDLEFATQLKDNAELLKEDRDKLRRYLKQRKNGNANEITYKLGRYCKHEHLGRLTAVGGLGLQCFQKDIRSALAERYYWDIDIVNAQPTLLVQYCEERGWMCNALKRYVANRDEVLAELMETLSIPKWEAKEKVVSLLFGASPTGLTTFLVDELAPELRLIMKNVWEANQTHLGFLKNKENKLGKAMAYVLQTEERRCLLAMDRAFGRRGRSLDVLIHDGGLVRKKEGESAMPSALLREVEKDVKTEVGYTINLIVKSLETTFVREERETEDDIELRKNQWYEDHKRMWEETGWKGATYFKVRHPPMFVALVDEGRKWEQMTKGDLLQNEEDHFFEEAKTRLTFARTWLEDPNKREYFGVCFRPKQEPPTGYFNLFRGFDVEPKMGSFDAFHRVLRLIANGDQRVFDYVENWAAHVIQKPWVKTRVAIVVQGRKGVGKDTYFNALGKIFGTHFFNTSTPEDNVFHKFNSAIARILLVKFEEANFATNKENEDKLKFIITSPTAVIEKKGHDSITLDSFINVVMTTNHEIPLPITDDERRFVLFKMSEEQRIDFKVDTPEVSQAKQTFWADVHRELEDPNTIAAYHLYLLNKDISNFNPFIDRVRTAYYDEVASSFVPHHARYFQRQIEHDEERTEAFEWRARDLFTDIKQAYTRFDLTETKFGREMRNTYIETGIIEKRRSARGEVYAFVPARMKQFLQDKGWWCEW